jgi:hypothetical protein
MERTFFALDLGLDIGDGVAVLDIEGHGFSSRHLSEDLHL